MLPSLAGPSSEAAGNGLDVSVIVVTYQSEGFIGRCLRSIEEHAGAAHAGTTTTEIVVVDNGSSDGTLDEARAGSATASLLPQGVNRGFAAATNVGAAQAHGAYLLLLNPDAELLPDALPSLLAYLEKHPEAAAVGPRLIYPDGTPQDSAFTYPSLLMTWLEFFPRPGRLLHTRINGRLSSRDGRAISIVHPLGACMLIRRTAWDDVGPLDEGFFLYCEEVDWCVRARKRGWDIAHVPSATAIHHEGRSAATARSASLVRLYASRKRLHRKHRGWLFQGLATFITTFGLTRERSRLRRRRDEGHSAPIDTDARIEGIERVLQRRP